MHLFSYSKKKPSKYLYSYIGTVNYVKHMLLLLNIKANEMI